MVAAPEFVDPVPLNLALVGVRDQFRGTFLYIGRVGVEGGKVYPSNVSAGDPEKDDRKARHVYPHKQSARMVENARNVDGTIFPLAAAYGRG